MPRRFFSFETILTEKNFACNFLTQKMIFSKSRKLKREETKKFLRLLPYIFRMLQILPRRLGISHRRKFKISPTESTI